MCLVESFCLALGLADVGVLHPLVGRAPLHGGGLHHRAEHVVALRVTGGLVPQPVLVAREVESVSYPGPIVLVQHLSNITVQY